MIQRNPQSYDLFIKTFPEDYVWLDYCLRSIEQFASGFRQTVVVYDTQPDGDPWPVPLLKAKIKIHPVSLPAQPDGYMWQQVVKLHADIYSDADVFVMIDSDTIFTQSVTPESFLNEEGKIKWMMTPYEKTLTPWQRFTEKFLTEPEPLEFMRRFPFTLPRWLLVELRGFCQEAHDVSLDTYIMNQKHRAFSEFNAIGAFAHKCFPDDFEWINTEEVAPENWPRCVVLQSWGRGGLTPEIREVYEKILATNT